MVSTARRSRRSEGAGHRGLRCAGHGADPARSRGGAHGAAGPAASDHRTAPSSGACSQPRPSSAWDSLPELAAPPARVSDRARRPAPDRGPRRRPPTAARPGCPVRSRAGHRRAPFVIAGRDQDDHAACGQRDRLHVAVDVQAAARRLADNTHPVARRPGPRLRHEAACGRERGSAGQQAHGAVTGGSDRAQGLEQRPVRPVVAAAVAAQVDDDPAFRGLGCRREVPDRHAAALAGHDVVAEVHATVREVVDPQRLIPVDEVARSRILRREAVRELAAPAAEHPVAERGHRERGGGQEGS